MKRNVFVLDENSKLIKKMIRNVNRLSFKMIALDFIFLIVVPLIVMFGVFGNYEVYDEIEVNTLLIYFFAIIMYFIFNFINSILSRVKFQEIRDAVIAKEDDTIFIITSKWISYEIGLKNETMMDEEIYRYRRQERNKLLKPTIEEVNVVLDKRPEGFYISEYKDCKLLKEKRDYYEFEGNKNDKLSRIKIYKAYLNIDFIIGGEI